MLIFVQQAFSLVWFRMQALLCLFRWLQCQFSFQSISSAVQVCLTHVPLSCYLGMGSDLHRYQFSEPLLGLFGSVHTGTILGRAKDLSQLTHRIRGSSPLAFSGIPVLSSEPRASFPLFSGQKVKLLSRFSLQR